VHSKSGDDGQALEGGTQRKGQAKRAKPEKMESKRSSLVPSHMLVTDVSRVKQATHLFKDLVFCILVRSHICWFLRALSDPWVYRTNDSNIDYWSADSDLEVLS